VDNVTSNWEVAYYISSFVIAFVAVVGFISAQKSSEKVSEALVVIQRGLSSLSEPMVKFSGYKWLISSSNAVSASNPPQGIMITYTNVSNVPIQLIDSDFNVLYGNKLLDDPGTPMGTETQETFILAPNESTQSGIHDPEVFEKYLSRAKNRTLPPHLNIKLTVNFKTMNNECYTYFIHKEIHFNMAQPDLQSSKTLKESLEKKSRDLP